MTGQDFILNGRGYGAIAEGLAECGWDPHQLRPYFDEYGRPTVTINTGRRDADGKPVYKQKLIAELTANGFVVNTPTTLRKLEWIELDKVVIRAARERLRAWSDLAAVSSYGGFNGMSKLILEHETMSDPGIAQVDFDGLSEARTDSPLFQLQGLPLPITHSDFWFSSRRLMVSRNESNPLDTSMGEAAGRRVAEMIEKTLIGTVTGPVYGGSPISYGRTSQVYGYTNFPPRITSATLRIPTGGGWAPSQTIADVLGAIQTLANQNFYGPFMLYHSTDWDLYMDQDYILTGGNVATQTLRNRLRSIEQIKDVRRLDFLKSATNPYTLLLVQMTPEVARAVNGMDITTVQWPSAGGFRLNFKVLCIQVPQLRADYNSNCGICHMIAA